jgi:predicted transcriptional regulator
MANRFRTVIEADDQTAKGFKSAAGRFKAFDGHIARLGRMGGSRLSGLTGGLRGLSSAASETSGGMAEVAGGAMGVGRAFGVAGLAIGAGIAVIAKAGASAFALASGLSKSGMEIRQTAGLIGIAGKDLQNLRGAGVFEGVDPGAMTAGLSALSKTLRAASVGEDVEAQGLINRFKIITKTKDGLFDTKEALLEIADIIARQKSPQTQEAIAEKFGLGGVLALLKTGRAGVEAAMARNASAGGNFLDEQTAAAKRFSNATTDMSNRWGAMKKSFSEKFILPWATPAIDKLTELFTWADHLMGGHSTPPTAAPSSDVAPGTPGTPGGAQPGGGAAPDPGRWDARRGRWVWSGGQGGGSAGMAINNPGNIRTSDGRHFRRFASPEAGLNAMTWQLKRYQDVYGLRTITGIVSRWAPKSENNTPAYIAAVAKRTGFDPNANLNLHDPQTLAKLEEAMIYQETHKVPFSRDQLLASAGKGEKQRVQVDVQFRNAPPGTTFQVRGHDDHGISDSYIAGLMGHR